MKNFTRNACLGLMGLACLTQASASAATFNFQTINNPADTTFNQLLGVNNSGTIVGYYGSGMVNPATNTITNPNKGYSVVLQNGNPVFTPENFPNSAQTQVVGINNNSSPTTVGFWVDANGNNFGFSKQGSSFPSVSGLPSSTTTQFLGVNDSNVAAGFYTDAAGTSHGFTYGLGTSTLTAVNLPSSFNAANTTATGINNAGIVSGFFTDGADLVHGFMDSNGVFTQLDDPNGSNTQVLGLNNNGEYVGSFVDGNGVTDGFTYNALTKTWTTVNDPSNSSTAAFGVTGTTINGVNDLGQVVGFYSDGANVDGFLATPTPEPASLGLLGFSLVAGGLALRRKIVKQ